MMNGEINWQAAIELLSRKIITTILKDKKDKNKKTAIIDKPDWLKYILLDIKEFSLDDYKKIAENVINYYEDWIQESDTKDNLKKK